MILHADCDILNALDGQELTSNILSHHVGEVRCTQVSREMHDDGEMSVFSCDGFDEAELQDRLVEFRIEHTVQTRRNGIAIRHVSLFCKVIERKVAEELAYRYCFYNMLLL